MTESLMMVIMAQKNEKLTLRDEDVDEGTTLQKVLTRNACRNHLKQ